ncbi:hypothetical protein [Vibrio metschnikovii]|uniref:hypothetical protein n=1 Tax=Vibrio metschnikovii TaxID=28172 RepID=UPI001C30534B|nr:hypothetical protein [Vibrio metschnikovii]
MNSVFLKFLLFKTRFWGVFKVFKRRAQTDEKSEVFVFGGAFWCLKVAFLMVFGYFWLFAQTLWVAALDRRGLQRVGYGHCSDLTGLRLIKSNYFRK